MTTNFSTSEPTRPLRKFRHCVLIGVGRGGTSSIAAYLSRHPMVTLSAPKETHFFTPLRYHMPAHGTYAQYVLRFFPTATPGQTLLEATPDYFGGGADLAKPIANFLPGALAVVSLRQPAQRFLSVYYLYRQLGWIQTEGVAAFLNSCLEAVSSGYAFTEEGRAYRALTDGLYYRHLPSWWEAFGDSLKLAFFDDLEAHPERFMSGLTNNLALRTVEGLTQSGRHNRAVVPRSTVVAGIAERIRASGVLVHVPRARRLLRTAYYSCNDRRPNADEDHAHGIDEVYDYYASSIVKLRDLFESRGETCSLPRWLQGGA